MCGYYSPPGVTHGCSCCPARRDYAPAACFQRRTHEKTASIGALCSLCWIVVMVALLALAGSAWADRGAGGGRAMGSLFFAMLALAFALASCAAAVGGCCCLNLCDADAGDVEALVRREFDSDGNDAVELDEYALSGVPHALIKGPSHAHPKGHPTLITLIPR